MSPRQRPVFSDPSGHRAKITNLVLFGIALLVSLGLVVVALGIIVSPDLPGPSAPEEIHRTSATPVSALIPFDSGIAAQRSREPSTESRHARRFAYLSGDDEASFIALRRNSDRIDAVIANWPAIELRNGAVRFYEPHPDDDSVHSQDVVDWVSANAPRIAIYPELSIRTPLPRLAMALANGHERAGLLSDIKGYVKAHGFAGLVLDTSDLMTLDGRMLLRFLADLGQVLRQDGRELIISVPAAITRNRLQELVQFADFILVSAHDQYTVRHSSGPAAAQGWFEERVWNAASVVPAEKLIVSIGSYGLEFDSHGNSEEISVQRAWDLLRQNSADLRFDGRSLNPGFVFTKSTGLQHEVWFLDAVTAFNQARAAMALGASGIAVWRLGMEDIGVWDVVGRDRMPDAEALARMEHIAPGYGALDRIKGSVISLRPGNPGERSVSFDRNLGLIVNQTLSRIPSFAVATAWKARDPKLVALTFDDGPDPLYTPRILDILAKKNVKATFYVVGRAAMKNSNILHRIYDEGHDIGNHTFSHSNLYSSNFERIAAALNSTQRIFEAELGVGTVLFRAPYERAQYGFLEISPPLIESVYRLGYLWGGFNVEPHDYVMPPDWIVETVIRKIAERNANGFVVRDNTGLKTVVENEGNVVLLHDSGGDRENTVKALPLIIDRLQAQGYRLVATHELVGLPRDALMPPFKPNDAMLHTEAGIRMASFKFAGWFGTLMPQVAIITAILGVLRCLAIGMLAFVQHGRRRRAGRPKKRFRGSVAILVPAFNEEKVICKTVSGLLATRYRGRFEIIVIDDGSSDRTAEVVREAFASDPRVKVFRKENGGKATALNFGFGHTRAGVVVAIDGDTVLADDAIGHLVRPFGDPTVGAVAGKVVVGNQINFMTRVQALEYVTSQNLDRNAFEMFNAIGVVPGAIGAWRRKAVLEAGGYSHDTLAEDADLTIALERAGWRVTTQPAACAYTEAPESLRAFLKQRFRWMFGTLQVARKHVDALWKGPAGVSLVTIPNAFIFQFGFTLLAPVMDLILLYILLTAAAGMVGYGDAQTDTLLLITQYWLVFQVADLLAASAGIALNGERVYWRFLPLILLQRFTYRQLLYWTATRALLAAAKGALVGWGKLVRTGSVAIPPSTASAR